MWVTGLINQSSAHLNRLAIRLRLFVFTILFYLDSSGNSSTDQLTNILILNRYISQSDHLIIIYLSRSTGDINFIKNHHPHDIWHEKARFFMLSDTLNQKNPLKRFPLSKTNGVEEIE